MTDALSIIVPVHDEGELIEATATALFEELPENAEVVFACNGCSDDSAAKLRAVARERATVLELRHANKALAIAEAEKHVRAFPRFYIDSDVFVSGSGIVKLAAALADRDLELVSPRIEFDETGSSWAAHAVNSVWLSLPHGASGGFHHVLGVSKEGRSRWDQMPNVTGDDAFIEAHIEPQRKAIIGEVCVRTRPPRTLWSFIRVRERWLRGDRQLAEMGIRPPKVAGQRRALTTLARAKGKAVPVALYILARLVAAGLASKKSKHSTGGWYRDATSRVG